MNPEESKARVGVEGGSLRQKDVAVLPKATSLPKETINLGPVIDKFKEDQTPPSQSQDKKSDATPQVESETKSAILPATIRTKGFSKYDLVKVRVRLEEHYYVFSRFLISHVLQFCKVAFTAS